MFLKSTGQFLCRMFLSLSFFHVSSATEMLLPIHYIIEGLWYKLVIGDINFYHLVNMLLDVAMHAGFLQCKVVFINW